MKGEKSTISKLSKKDTALAKKVKTAKVRSAWRHARELVH
jgi:hypothetical protein